MTRTYERFGFLISRNSHPGASFRWEGWHPELGRFVADTLAGAFQMARHMHEGARQ
jgi:hypothetical protein